MKLLIDIGNSRLKWTLDENGLMGPAVAVDYRQPSFSDELRRTWSEMAAPKQAALASVAGSEVTEQIGRLMADLWPNLPVFVARSSAYALGVRNGYQQPEKLGIDRWLALLAAHLFYPGKVCVVDCGTAITVDALADGEHLGGLIGPGITTMQKALLADTAGLSLDNHSAGLHFVNDTSAAIANGTLLAAVGLIELSRQRLGCEFQLLLTGGDAQAVADHFNGDAVVDAELVLKGLSALLDEGKAT